MFKNYIAIARPDHWFKNIFMLPGMAVALVLEPRHDFHFLATLLVAILSTCLVASANYVINEYLDRDQDRLHPTKQFRPCAQGLVSGGAVLAEYLLLAAAGMVIAWMINTAFFAFSAALLIMGLAYNVPPVRTKDKPVLDVLSESVNNPLRFLLGWAVVIPAELPPSSVLLAYWFGGAFLMAVKRLAEYRSLGSPELAAEYRRSFRFYSESRLLLTSFFYALNAAFFLGIFLVKYRIEFVLSFPLFAVLFTWYLHIGLKKDSTTQTPEKLYREKGFAVFAVFLCLAIAVLFFVDIPTLHVLLQKNVY